MSISVCIFGTGAIGSFYGAMLHKGGASVSTVQRSDYDHVKKQGIVIESETLAHSFMPKKVYRPEDSPEESFDYLVIATKALMIPDLHEKIRNFVSPKTSLVLIQNGIDVEDQLAPHYPHNELISCLAFICVTKTSPGTVSHMDYGRITLGSYPKGTSTGTETLAELFSKSIQCGISEDIIKDRWIKLIWNAPFNPISALAGGANTLQLLSDKATKELIITVMKEVRSIASKAGVAFPETVIDGNIEATLKMTPYIPSMGVDALEKRGMEVEAILGRPIAIAEELSVPVPAMELLHTLLKQLNSTITEK
jgi:2-dehydropantoate 2-reductase